jgi:hypothetical protein
MDRLHAIWREGREPRLEDLPTLGELRAYHSDFPTDAVQGKTNALCLFAAWFCGRSDVIHVLDAGIRHATLVDKFAPGMAAVRQLYPPNWAHWCGDYRDFLASAEPAGFDLVVADQPREYGSEVAITCLPAIARLCAPRFTFVVNYWRETVAELGAARTNLPALSRALSDRSGIVADFRWMERRVPELDWAVIEIGGSAPR